MTALHSIDHKYIIVAVLVVKYNLFVSSWVALT